jgi:hypothetical protein
VGKRSGLYPRVRVDAAGKGVVSHAGGTLMTATIRASGLDDALSAALAPWRKPLAIHDPAKVLLDLAVALDLGGDCLADIAMVRAEPAVFGLVASDPTVSARSTPSRRMPRRRCGPSTQPAPPPGRRHGSWPARTPRTPGSTPPTRS